jgi:hypothetical protein
MGLTRKHFDTIAKAIRTAATESGTYEDLDGWSYYIEMNAVVDSVGKALAEENPNFDIEKFQNACWGETWNRRERDSTR